MGFSSSNKHQKIDAMSKYKNINIDYIVAPFLILGAILTLLIFEPRFNIQVGTYIFVFSGMIFVIPTILYYSTFFVIIFRYNLKGVLTGIRVPIIGGIVLLGWSFINFLIAGIDASRIPFHLRNNLLVEVALYQASVTEHTNYTIVSLILALILFAFAYLIHRET